MLSSPRAGNIERVFEAAGDRYEALLAECRQAESDAAAAFVRQCEAALAVYEATPAGTRTDSAERAESELALALGLTALAVGQRVHQAQSLATYPLLQQVLLAGGLRVPHALALTDELGALGDPVLAGRVLQQVLTGQTELGWSGTPSALRVAVRREAVRLDPVAAEERRRERLAADTRVRLRARYDGAADLTATGPAEQLTATDRMLDTLASSDDPDDGRTHGQRKLDALVAAVAARAGTAVPIELQLEIPVDVVVAGVCEQTVLPEPVVVRTALDAQLLGLLAGGGNVTVSNEPAPVRRRRGGVPEMVGHGPVDPGLLRDLLADRRGMPVGLGQVQVRRLLVDRTGQVVAADRSAVPLARLLPGRPDPAREPAVPEPPADRKRPADRELPSDRELPLDAEPSLDPEPPPGCPADLLRRLLHALPPPPPRTTAHRPTAAQTRVVQARDRTCVFPGCSRASVRSDLDHQVRHPDGPTSVANLHTLCRHHHRLKHDGWTCTRAVDGSTTWTSPAGQVRRVRPC